MNLLAISSFDKGYEQLSMNRRIEVSKFESEPTFGKTMNENKANHFKIITSIDMNVSAITSNKPSLSYEYIESDLIPWILLLSRLNRHNSSNICLQCTLKETPNYKL